jgi:hypothetical protein
LKLAAAAAAGQTRAAAVAACVQQARGLDIHPVAVIIARVTWLLALGPAIEQRVEELHVPVYLGDAMQWNLRQVGDARDVIVSVPDESPLHVPAGFAEDQARFDYGLRALAQGLQEGASPAQVDRSLLRIDGVAAPDASAMVDTFLRLRELYDAGRNGIWPFVLRNLNLTRPLWLSRPERRADVLLGNPPWVAYRHLSAEMKPRLRVASQQMNLWVGGVLTTQQDLCALFWARGAERYLKQGGTSAFVLPYAALNRPAFGGLRRGNFGSVQVRIVEAWDVARVRPIFGRTAIGTTSACVLFGRREPTGSLPAQVERFIGALPRRDATEAQADAALQRGHEPWPAVTTLEGASPYRARFRQRATIVPRRFFLVEREAAGQRVRPSHAQGATLFVLVQPLPSRLRFGGMLFTAVLSVTLEGQPTPIPNPNPLKPVLFTAVLPITVLPADTWMPDALPVTVLPRTIPSAIIPVPARMLVT